jgi:hydrogenase expression/formation protein HypC
MCLGVPGKVVSTETNALGVLMGKVSFGGTLKEVCLSFVPEVVPGQYVIVHAGFAISLLDEAEARETLDLLQEVALAEPTPELGEPPLEGEGKGAVR